ncbi:hypothetical protein NAAC61_09610 [Petrotoga sp. 8T1HF07.NaAc.6.1]|nr:hypothetical protein [Petrotoga sp. 8T1HF07.NaAc.6.1]
MRSETLRGFPFNVWVKGTVGPSLNGRGAGGRALNKELFSLWVRSGTLRGLSFNVWVKGTAGPFLKRVGCGAKGRK